MHRYFIKIPWIIKKLFPNFIWSLTSTEKEVFITFDDGPHPIITPWVLDQLKWFGAKGTFFCIGKNVELYPDVYQKIIDEGHGIGNHTQTHMNGWKTDDQQYIDNILRANQVIQSDLFRPPYGRIKRSQVKLLKKQKNVNFRVVMWDVLSADFDKECTPEGCVNNVVKNVREGSVVVFHDSEKAYDNLAYALPVVLKHLKKNGYKLSKLR
jgi:peptidoglycan/xylan/chitin deacetylase (PgdA/CDA1 family)